MENYPGALIYELKSRVDDPVEKWVKRECRKVIVIFRFCQLGQLVAIYPLKELLKQKTLKREENTNLNQLSP